MERTKMFCPTLTYWKFGSLSRDINTFSNALCLTNQCSECCSPKKNQEGKGGVADVDGTQVTGFTHACVKEQEKIVTEVAHYSKQNYSVDLPYLLRNAIICTTFISTFCQDFNCWICIFKFIANNKEKQLDFIKQHSLYTQFT